MSLYPFQREGVDFLKARDRAYLGDEMGLGKTVQTLVAAYELGLESVVVVCPASLTSNWEKEAAEWAPGVDVYPVSYDRVRIDKAFPHPDPQLVILDEAHYLKNPKAKRTKTLIYLLKNVRRIWLLSGTPMPNDPRELYVPARILNPRGTRDFTAWKWMHTFCQVIESHWGPKVVGVKNAGKLREIFRDHFTGRRLNEVSLDLPPLRITTQSLPPVGKLPEELHEALRAMEQEELYGEGASRLRRLLGELKAPLVADQIYEEMEDGAYDAIVVMAYHRSVLDVLEHRLKSLGVSRVDGSTPGRRRQEQVELFQRGKTAIFLGQQTAAGVGLTLTRASELVLVEPDWSPENNNQAIKRIHRISQDAPCRARIFTIPGTLDASVMGTLARKTRMIEEVGL